MFALILIGIVLVIDVETCCLPTPGIQSAPHGYKTVTYATSNEALENPGRGYIETHVVHANNFEPLSKFQLDVLRLNTGATLIMRHYVLGEFVSSVVSEAFINKVRDDLSVTEDAGFMAVLLFSYSVNLPDPAQPPFGDASKWWMKIHIGQLNELFREFEGIILTVKAGFIGTWGEWYYTDHFGFGGPLTQTNLEDRREVVESLLEAVPESIQIQLRTPYFKRTLFGQAAITYRDILKKTTKSRIAFNNDCFLADQTDSGTYIDYPQEYAYLQEDNRFAIAGGETCSLSDTGRHLCPTALKELKELHFTYMSRSYKEDVLDTWKTGGCYDKIRNGLGYRFSLKQSILPIKVRRDCKMSFEIILENTGYAAPVRSMNVYLVLLSHSSQVYRLDIDTDTRTWLPGKDIVLSGAAKVPMGIPKGNFNVAIAIGDKLMHERSDYYILLANQKGTPQEPGINSLSHVVEIDDEPDGCCCGAISCPTFSPWRLPVPTHYPRVLGRDGCVKSRLTNYDFEEGISGWTPSSSNVLHLSDAQNAKHGSGYIKISDGYLTSQLQFVKNSKEPTQKIMVRGWSKHSGQVTTSSSDYSVYCDVFPIVGSPIYGRNAPFQNGDTGRVWHNATLQITVTQGIDHAYCHLMYRHQPGGFAYFDLVDVWILSGNADFSDCSE